MSCFCSSFSCFCCLLLLFFIQVSVKPEPEEEYKSAKVNDKCWDQIRNLCAVHCFVYIASTTCNVLDKIRRKDCANGIQTAKECCRYSFFHDSFFSFSWFFRVECINHDICSKCKAGLKSLFLFFYLFRKRFLVLISIFCLLFSIFHCAKKTLVLFAQSVRISHQLFTIL